MEWFNHFAPAIQAFAAIGILLLTGLLAWANWEYVRLLQEHAVRQRPVVLVGLNASGLQIFAFAKSASGLSVILETVSVRLVRRDIGKGSKWCLRQLLSHLKQLGLTDEQTRRVLETLKIARARG
jgi:hypothetical protein